MSTSNLDRIRQLQPSNDEGPSEVPAKVHSWWDSDFSTAQGAQDALSKGALGALWLSVVLVWGWFTSDAEMKPGLSAEGVGHAITAVLSFGIGPFLAWRIKQGGIIATWISFLSLGIYSLVCVIVFMIVIWPIPQIRDVLQHGLLGGSVEQSKASYRWLMQHGWEIVRIVVVTLGSLIAFTGSVEALWGTYKLRGRTTWSKERRAVKSHPI
jgi:hypothetical protein